MNSNKVMLFVLLGIVILAIVGLLFSRAELTGQSYRYAEQMGPAGQRPIKETDKFFMVHKEVFPKQQSNQIICCNYNKLGANNYYNCPKTEQELKDMCSVADEEIDYGVVKNNFFRPPCPPAHINCFYPGDINE